MNPNHILHQVFDLTFGHVAGGLFYADSGFLSVELGRGAPAIYVAYVRPAKAWGRPSHKAPHVTSADTSTGWGCDAAGHWYQLRWRPNKPVRARNISGRPWEHIPPLTADEKKRHACGMRNWGRFNRLEEEAKKKLQDARLAWLASKCDLI